MVKALPGGLSFTDVPDLIPFSVELVMNGSNAAVTPAAASAAVGTELFPVSKACRNRIDLSRARFARLVAVIIANGNAPTTTWKLSYCTADAATWASGTGVADAGPALAVGTGTVGVVRDTGWVALPAGAQIDNAIVSLLVGTAAHGTTPPTCGSVTAYFR